MSNAGRDLIVSLSLGDEIVCDLRLKEDTALIILLVLWCDIVYAKFIFISGDCCHFHEIRLLSGRIHVTTQSWPSQLVCTSLL